MLKILIVDDSFFMRAALRLQLKAIGCEVVGEAANMQQALERYRELRPDLVTVDLVMDPDSGIQVTQEICQIDPKAKILIVSAVGQKEIMEETRNAGASGYVIKPVELNPLKDAIEKMTGLTLKFSSPVYAGLTQERLDKILVRGLDMAAKSLSILLGREVQVSINEFRLVPLGEVARTLGEPDHVIIGVSFKLTGELEGYLFLLLERPGVLTLMDALLKRPSGGTKTFGEIERDAVNEVANILANAYLNSLSQEINLTVMPGPPHFSEIPLGDLLESLILEQSEIAVADRFLLMRNSLVASDLTLDGNLVMFLKRTGTAKE